MPAHHRFHQSPDPCDAFHKRGRGARRRVELISCLLSEAIGQFPSNRMRADCFPANPLNGGPLKGFPGWYRIASPSGDFRAPHSNPHGGFTGERRRPIGYIDSDVRPLDPAASKNTARTHLQRPEKSGHAGGSDAIAAAGSGGGAEWSYIYSVYTIGCGGLVGFSMLFWVLMGVFRAVGSIGTGGFRYVSAAVVTRAGRQVTRHGASLML